MKQENTRLTCAEGVKPLAAVALDALAMLATLATALLLLAALAPFSAHAFATESSPSRPGETAPSGDVVMNAGSDLAPGTSPELIEDGTYVFDSAKTTTGMIPVSQEDGPVMAIVNGNDVTIVLDVYSPSKYDKLYPGKRSEAPDPLSSGLIYGQFVLAGDYSGSTEIWTDSKGIVGPANNRYKSIRFLIPMTKNAFADMLNNNSDKDLYVTVRRSSWSPSNALKWMGSNDHYVTLGTASKQSDSTDIPTTGFTAPNDEQEQTPAEDPIVRVKALIDLLPRNPYIIGEQHRTAIEKAKAAYDDLSAADQKKLDDETLATQSYGRTLESAVWSLDSLAAVNDATTLADGTYTTQAKATCSLGKSDSARMRLFKLVKIIVKDGHAQALIEHDTSTSDTVKIGSKEYRHVNTDEKAHSQFLVPVNLNSTFHLSQFAKNATENTVGIVYEMSISIDEAKAKPDSAPSGSSESNNSGSGNSGSDGSSGSGNAAGGSTASGSGSGNGSGTQSTANGTRNNTSALAAVANAQRTGTGATTGNSQAGGADNSKASEAAQDKDSAKTKDNAKGSSAKVAVASAGDASSDGSAASASAARDATGPLLQYTLAGLAILAVLGIGSFTAVFLRRESRLATWLQASGLR